MRMFEKAYFTVGMRFHSVVLQTLLNGKNFVFDYTSAGKTVGFLERIKAKDHYQNQFVDLRNPKAIEDLKIDTVPNKFVADRDQLNAILEVYQRFQI